MDRQKQKGSITIFLSLTCILFLSLICTAVESARVQGARAQAANIMGMGNFSLLGEFEPELLEQYNIFSLDGTYGNGSFQIEKVNSRLRDYASCNADPRRDTVPFGCFDPWNLELTDSAVSEYALLTDGKGEPFYQQAVSYMKTNMAAIAAGRLLEYRADAERVKGWQKEYEKQQAENDRQLSGLEAERQKKLQIMESEAAAEAASQSSAGNGTVSQSSAGDGTASQPPAGNGANSQPFAGSGSASQPFTRPGEPAHNPLQEIAKLRKKSILSIVTWDREVSGKQVKTGSFPSKNRLKEGTLDTERKHQGMAADALFREYLLMHFPFYGNDTPKRTLDYQLEYLLGGKDSDEKNLKHVVGRLLLLREGMNYLYCLQNGQIQSQAQSLAVTLTGFLGIPALTAATRHALMLAWAYGESLVDVRILLDGGKIPLQKDAASWSLSLENLGRITEILRAGAADKGTGLSYRDYLRILLNLESLSAQKMRALDLIQAELQSMEDCSGFKAENCIVALKSSTSWRCRPVFLRLPAAVTGLRARGITIKQEGSIAY